MNIARRIWLSPVLRESVLMIIAALGVTLALSLADLSAALDDPAVGPLDDIMTWLTAIWVALLTTAVKQTSVVLLTRLADVVSVTEEPPPASGEIQNPLP